MSFIRVPTELDKLAVLAGRGDREAANQVIIRCKPLIKKYTNRYSRAISWKEAEQEVAFFIFQTTKFYNPELSSFIGYVIRGLDRFLVTRIRPTNSLIHVSYRFQIKIRKSLRKHNTIKEVAKDLNKSEQIVEDALRASRYCISLPLESLDSCGVSNYGYLYNNKPTSNPEECLLEKEERARIIDKLKEVCTSSEVEIVLSYINGKTFNKIAEEKEVSRQCIHQKYNRALLRLRKTYNNNRELV